MYYSLIWILLLRPLTVWKPFNSTRPKESSFTLTMYNVMTTLTILWWSLCSQNRPDMDSIRPLQLRDMKSLKVESGFWWFLAEKQRGGMQESLLSHPLFFSFQSSLPGSFLICSHKLGCTTGSWFTPTAGAPRGDQDPPRMSNKSDTLSISSGLKTRGEGWELNRNDKWNNTNLPLLWELYFIVHYDAHVRGNFYRNYVKYHCRQNEKKSSATF